MSQLDFFGGEVTGLTERQRAVYEFVCQQPSGITANDAGAYLHSLKGKHSYDDRCEWDGRDGRSVLEALVAKGLLKRTRPGDGSGYRYVLAAAAGSSEGAEWSQTDEIPF